MSKIIIIKSWEMLLILSSAKDLATLYGETHSPEAINQHIETFFAECFNVTFINDDEPEPDYRRIKPRIQKDGETSCLNMTEAAFCDFVSNWCMSEFQLNNGLPVVREAFRVTEPFNLSLTIADLIRLGSVDFVKGNRKHHHREAKQVAVEIAFIEVIKRHCELLAVEPEKRPERVRKEKPVKVAAEVNCKPVKFSAGEAWYSWGYSEKKRLIRELFG